MDVTAAAHKAAAPAPLSAYATRRCWCTCTTQLLRVKQLSTEWFAVLPCSNASCRPGLGKEAC